MHEEYILLRYKRSFAVNDPKARILHLEGIFDYCVEHKDKFSISSNFYPNQIKDQIDLIKIQSSIDMEDANSKSPLIRNLPRKPRITFSSVNRTLHYCSLYHYGEKKQFDWKNLCKRFDVPSKRSTWIQLHAKAEQRNWDILKKIPKKTRFKSKLKSPIGFEPFVFVAAVNRAPQDVLEFFASEIENDESRFKIAVHYKLFYVAINAAVKLRHRQKLNDLRPIIQKALPTQDAEKYLVAIQSALADPKTKWKD
eukprot:Anaeramoba_ignava/a358092_21.p2 GENE.a358092_21~~a358092_21.p2  ORF type:complete len:253 (+),score=84.78 a358092_21:890-1648(+)